jgi:hypothetical protein
LVFRYASPRSARLRAKIFSKEKKKKKKVVLKAEVSKKSSFFKKILPGLVPVIARKNDSYFGRRT